MEKFNEIEKRTESAILACKDARNDVAGWREDVRDMVHRVSAQLISFVEEYAKCLSTNFLDLPAHPVMREFTLEDRA